MDCIFLLSYLDTPLASFSYRKEGLCFVCCLESQLIWFKKEIYHRFPWSPLKKKKKEKKGRKTLFLLVLGIIIGKDL